MRVWLEKLESRGRTAARFVALFGMLGLVGLVLLINTDVLSRWLFNRPIDGVSDIAPLIVAIVVATFFPFALAERHHIAIDFLGRLLGRAKYAWLETLAALVTLFFFVLLAWQFVLYTIDLGARGQTTWVIQLPVAPWWSVVSLFIVLCVPIQLVVLLVRFTRAKAGIDPDGAAADSPDDTLPTDSRS